MRLRDYPAVGACSALPQLRVGLVTAVLAIASSVAPPTAASDDNSGALQQAPAEAAARRAEGEQRFRRGLELAKEQRWDTALAEFLASRELFATRAATRNAAIALQRLERYAESYELYEDLLAEFGNDLGSEQLESVRRELEDVKAQTASLVVDSSEQGVTVVLDGQGRGKTPLAGDLRVNPGSHVLRLSKEGFESVVHTITVAVGKTKSFSSRLRPLSELGALFVREAEHREMQVLVDGAAVGMTPWSGLVNRGAHSVQLRSAAGWGTPPGAVLVRSGVTNTVVLRASELDASLRIEPTPSTSAVYLDGILLGSGIWAGRIPSGQHRIEAISPGHWLFRTQVTVSRGAERVVRAQLERDSSNPLWRRARRNTWYAELGLGGLLAPSLRSVSGSCHCRGRGAFGVNGSALLGYALGAHLGLEASFGALTIEESVGQELRRQNDTSALSWRSVDFEESVRLTGPWLGLGAALRAFSTFPLTARVGAGVAALHSAAASSGTFVSEPFQMSRSVAIAEQSEWLLTPFVSTELRIGYALSDRLSLDLGLGLRLFSPVQKPRRDTEPTFGDSGSRAQVLQDESGDRAKAGLLTLPDGRVAGMFLALSPVLGARLAF